MPTFDVLAGAIANTPAGAFTHHTPVPVVTVLDVHHAASVPFAIATIPPPLAVATRPVVAVSTTVSSASTLRPSPRTGGAVERAGQGRAGQGGAGRDGAGRGGAGQGRTGQVLQQICASTKCCTLF